MTTPSRHWFRFRLRTLFVVVAVCAIALGLWRRASHLNERYRFHKIHGLTNLLWQYSDDTHLPPPEELATYYEQTAYHKAQAEYHQAMMDKCGRMIWRPWVVLESEPEKPLEPMSATRRTKPQFSAH